MFDAHDHDGHASTPFLLPDSSGLDRLWAACTAAVPEPETADNLREFVAAHRLVWDMPSLDEVFPEIVEHLEARYLVQRRGETVTVTTLTDGSAEDFEIADVRYVVDILLSREYRESLWRESVLPSFDRLVG
jgi:hypothetical protein